MLLLLLLLRVYGAAHVVLFMHAGHWCRDQGSAGYAGHGVMSVAVSWCTVAYVEQQQQRSCNYLSSKVSWQGAHVPPFAAAGVHKVGITSLPAGHHLGQLAAAVSSQLVADQQQ